MQIQCLHTGPLAVNTYVVYGKTEGQALVIDPADARPVLRFLEQKGLSLSAILITHGHFDHLLGVAELKEKTEAKVYIHKEDAEALSDNKASMSYLMNGWELVPSKADVLLEGEEKLELASFSIRVIHTPGHSRGGVCYLFGEERTIFSGDTLFYHDVGRCDLPGGSAQTLFNSISQKLFSLPGDYEVYPGHEGFTSMDEERQRNHYMNREISEW